MRRLILIRHIKARQYDNIQISDLDRNLEDCGIKDASIMGKFLKTKNIIPELIISSNSKRTKQTLSIILKELKKDIQAQYNEIIYENEETKIIELVNTTDNKINCLMLIGHNPSMEGLTMILAKTEIPGHKFATSGIAIIDYKIEAWDRVNDTTGNLYLFKTPKMLI